MITSFKVFEGLLKPRDINTRPAYDHEFENARNKVIGSILSINLARMEKADPYNSKNKNNSRSINSSNYKEYYKEIYALFAEYNWDMPNNSTTTFVWNKDYYKAHAFVQTLSKQDVIVLSQKLNTLLFKYVHT